MDAELTLPPRLLRLALDLPLEELAFHPVPVRARHDGWTPERQQAFILRLALTGAVGYSARAVGKTRRGAYRLRSRPGAESFAAAWDEALRWGQSRTLDIGMERSMLGQQYPIRRAGRVTGYIHRKDNRLAMSVLNAMDRLARRPVAPAIERAMDAVFEYGWLKSLEAGPEK